MEITLVGWITLILSIYGFIKNERFLLYVAVFLSTFTATAFLNIEITTTGIAPFYLSAGLWMLRCIIDFIRSGKKISFIIGSIKENKLIQSLLVFSFIVIIGVLYIMISGKNIIILDLNSNEILNLGFTSSNITQPMYLLFMVFFSIFISLKMKNKKDIINLIKIFCLSTTFALVWGIIQFCMFYLGIEYPAYLFNNNISAEQLYYQMVYGIKRVNSIALEPSTFSLNILMFLPLVMILWLGNYRITENKLKSNVVLSSLIILALVCGILTTSSTSYVGIALLIVLLTIYILAFSNKEGQLYDNKKRVIVFYGIGVVSLFLVLFLCINIFGIHVQTLVDTFKDMTINKVNLESGNIRGNVFKMSLEIFKKSPIVGMGWGTYRSLDTISNLLANTGLLGFLVFDYIIYLCIKSVILLRDKDEVMALAFALMILIPTIALFISIPDLVFGYYWMMIALVYNYCNISKEEQNIENRN